MKTILAIQEKLTEKGDLDCLQKDDLCKEILFNNCMLRLIKRPGKELRHHLLRIPLLLWAI